MLRTLTTAASLLALAASALPAAHAGGITYTVRGVGSGTLDNQAFTNAAFSIVSTADTAAITHPAPGVFFVTDLTSSVTVAGLGTDSFSFNPSNAVNQNTGVNGAGVSDLGQGLAILFVHNPVFAAYDLSTAIGPVSGTPSFNRAATFATTAGDFSLSTVSSATFTATTAAVPEASTTVSFGLLLALGMGGMVIAKRRKA